MAYLSYGHSYLRRILYSIHLPFIKYIQILMEGCEMPLSYTYSKYLFYSSFFIGGSSAVSLYFQDVTVFIIMFTLFISSINFWYKPDYGLERDIDMILCKLICVYFFLYTLSVHDIDAFFIYMAVLTNIIFLYGMELLLYSYKNKKWIVFHIIMHFYLAFMLPFVLYIM